MLPLIEHGKGKGSDITGMECVLPGNRMEIILDRIDQHMLALIPVLVINRIIVMEEEPFTKAAAGDRKIRRLGFPDDFLNSPVLLWWTFARFLTVSPTPMTGSGVSGNQVILSSLA